MPAPRDQSSRCRSRPPATCGSSRISCGVPSAISSPRASTMMRSACANTTSMLCSVNSTRDAALAHQFARSAPSGRCARAAPCRRSARPSAAASARWRARSRVRPLDVAVGEHRAGLVGALGDADLREQRERLVAVHRARRAASMLSNCRRCESSAICTFSRTVIEPKVAAIWKVRPTPSRQIVARLAGRRGLRPSNRIAPGVGRELAVDHVEAGRLAGAVGADQRQQFAAARARSPRRRRPARRRTTCADPLTDSKASPCTAGLARAHRARPRMSQRADARSEHQPRRDALREHQHQQQDRSRRAARASTRSARTIVSCSQVKAAAPTTGPASVCTPPSSTITSPSIERADVQMLRARCVPLENANSAPASAAEQCRRSRSRASARARRRCRWPRRAAANRGRRASRSRTARTGCAAAASTPPPTSASVR